MVSKRGRRDNLVDMNSEHNLITGSTSVYHSLETQKTREENLYVTSVVTSVVTSTLFWTSDIDTPPEKWTTPVTTSTYTTTYTTTFLTEIEMTRPGNLAPAPIPIETSKTTTSKSIPSITYTRSNSQNSNTGSKKPSRTRTLSSSLIRTSKTLTPEFGSSSTSATLAGTSTASPLADISNGIPSGAIAGIVAGVIFLVLILAPAFFFCQRKRSVGTRTHLSLEKSGSNLERAVSPSGTNLSIASSVVPLLAIQPSRRAPDTPLDDSTILKLFSDMDSRITDHVINWWHNGDVDSPKYQAYLDSEAAKDSRMKTLFQAKPLMVDPKSRIFMFRAILAYHVYTAVADWRVLTTEQQSKILQVPASERIACRTIICTEIEASEKAFNKRTDFISSLLERDTNIHIAPNKKDNKLAKESLKEIARDAANLGLKLGLQPNEFKFDFRNKDYKGDVAKDLLAVRVLGESEYASKMMEVVNEISGEGRVRAVISPGVIRVPKIQSEYVMRRVKVFVS